MTDSTHYVANIKIEKVVKRENRSTGISLGQAGTSREVVETTNLCLKASTLDRLRDKIEGHVALLDEEDI